MHKTRLLGLVTMIGCIAFAALFVVMGIQRPIDATVGLLLAPPFALAAGCALALVVLPNSWHRHQERSRRRYQQRHS
jgi:hypothetical protein